jgi:hypothetical protein
MANISAEAEAEVRSLIHSLRLLIQWAMARLKTIWCRLRPR